MNIGISQYGGVDIGAIQQETPPSGIISGSASGSSTETGTLIGLGALSGNTSGSVVLTATLIGLGRLIGSSIGTSVCSGTLIGVGLPAGEVRILMDTKSYSISMIPKTFSITIRS